MGTILTQGTEIPSAGENGQQFCPELERNWTRYDEHDHSGGDKGLPVESQNITKATGSAPNTSWAADGTDMYKQTVTLPTNYFFDTTTIRQAIGNEIVSLRIEKVTNDTFDIWCNDNSVSVNFLYI